MISILLPSCNRIDLLMGCVASLEDTKGDRNVETVLVLDGYSDEDLHRIIPRLSGNYILDYSSERRGALFCWDRALRLSSGDLIFAGGDDQIFHPGWLDFVLESHQDKLGGYGVLGMNDLAYDGDKQLATMFVFDRRYCKDVMGGVFAPPMYNYYNIDSEWNEKAKMSGHFYWDTRAVVEHIHSAHGKRPVDSIDREKVDNNWMEIDNATFAQRKAEGFPVTWEPII